MFDKKKLRTLESIFLAEYPLGFEDPAIQQIGKKHRMDKMVEFTQQAFAKKAFTNIETVADNMVKAVSRSSMVSMFEKPKFRDFVKRMNRDEKAFLVHALKQMLHGNQQAGFEAMVDLLLTEKLAKWSLVTIIPAYYAPVDEVFVKPTTAKSVLRYFELDEPVYKPRPSWVFYQQYRALINDAKTRVNPNLSPSNAAFSGFLMMTVRT